MAQNINTVVVTGNLTKDPELRQTGGGTSICAMRVAVNGRRKDQSGEWIDDPNYFDVVAFGRSADNCANYLSKGRPVAVSGRLDWSEWETTDGQKRQAVKIIAESVQFLGGRDEANAPAPARAEAPIDNDLSTPAASNDKYDDIPF
jgi:single-strand DNA-binding protein